MQIKLNYDQIASDYNQRYPDSQTWDRGKALLKLASQLKAKTILEGEAGRAFGLTCFIKSRHGYTDWIFQWE